MRFKIGPARVVVSFSTPLLGFIFFFLFQPFLIHPIFSSTDRHNAQAAPSSPERARRVAAENQRRADLGNGFYLNPILGGEYPDPSVVRVGEDYYLTHTPGRGMPGLLIWHSRDLVNWEPVGHALHTFVGDIWAPDLIHYQGLFYIYFPALVRAPDGRQHRTNFVTTARNPAGPWTEPVDLNVGGIDPGHVADVDGRRYLYIDSGRLVPLAPDGLSVKGELRKVYGGWPIPRDWTVECFCLESPKLLFRRGFNYLVSAQGGTAGPSTSHMIVVARSPSPAGPWENSPHNPLLHTARADERWASQGHGTLIEATDGSWWVMYHGWERDFRTLGRMTLLLPVSWTQDGWPVIPDDVRSSEPIRKPTGEDVGHGLPLSDDFQSTRLGLQWRIWGEDESAGTFRPGNNELRMKALGSSVADAALLTCFPVDHAYEAEVEVTVPEGVTAGLLLHYDGGHFAGAAFEKGAAFCYAQGREFDRVLCGGSGGFLRVRNMRNEAEFFWSADGKSWTKFGAGAEVSGYHHNAFGNWGTLKIGLYAAGHGTAVFRHFRYRGLDKGPTS